MYITINKQWFEKNKAKLEAKSDNEDTYQISLEDDNKVELVDFDKNGLFISDSNENVYCSLTYKPKPETIVALVEDAIDDIKGEALTKIIEIVVKKLNKFKSLIESVRGL